MTRRPFFLGVTGSVGMGKSTTARMFAELGCPIWDADAAVHDIYRPGGPGGKALQELVPDAVGPAGVDRIVLKDLIQRDPELLGRIERVVHPLVAAHRQAFIDANRTAEMLVFDIPLLFETGAESWLDAVLVVTAPPDLQRERVMARPGMTETMFKGMLERQMPDGEKRRRANFVVSTARGVDDTRDAVGGIYTQIRERHYHA